MKSKEATTSVGGRRGPATTHQEEKEDIVGTVEDHVWFDD
jgi:hypothetical protein